MLSRFLALENNFNKMVLIPAVARVFCVLVARQSTDTQDPRIPGQHPTLTYTMKVLMFGWEFPPHISGGLGTACAGLTRALEKAGVDVVFTVPKLHGGELANGTTFISASAVPIRQKKIAYPSVSSTPSTHTDSHPSTASDSVARYTTIRKTERQTVIEVPAALSAYTEPEAGLQGLQTWNYDFTRAHGARQEIRRPVKGQASPAVEPRKVTYMKAPYQFSGTYGPSLLEEVERYAQVAAEIARRHDFDVIHAHDWMAYPAGIAAKKRSGKPLIVHVHATEVDRAGDQVNARVFEIEKKGMLAADKVITVSDWTKRIAIKHYGIDAGKIAVVHNGISPRALAPASAQALPFRAPIVTFLGRITHQKGPMYFVEAAKRVHEQLPDVHFVVAGAGDQLPQMIERIAEARLSRYFHFTGFLREADVDRIWSISNVYVMPSVSEPFGIAPLEAIQAGVPVILSKQAGVSEVMPHAIKVDFWNTEALADAICSLIRFKSLANTLKRNGTEQIKHITWDNAAKKLTTLYHEVTAKYESAKEPDPVLSGSSAKKITVPAVL